MTRRPLPPPPDAHGTLEYSTRISTIPHGCHKCAAEINLGDRHLAVRIHRGPGAFQRFSVCARCAGALLAQGRGRRAGGREGVA